MPIITREELWKLLEDQFHDDLLQSVSLTGIRDGKEELPQKYFLRPIRIKKEEQWQWTAFDTQSRQTHQNLSGEQSLQKMKRLLADVYRSAHLKTTQEEIQIHITKKEKVQLKRHPLKTPAAPVSKNHDAQKQYLFPDGTPCPFLVATGVMAPSGKVHRAMYRKFRQINRFAEFVYDLREHFPKDRPVRVVDYGCGKSYLTFAVRHLLVEKLGLQVEMLGLDSNKEVIASCLRTQKELQLNDLRFEQVQISEANLKPPIDLAIWLHACDTATDDALAQSVRCEARLILASPCCQHELFKQVNSPALQPLLKHGILRERLAAMVTDALRSQLLESIGYRSQIIEFIDLEHTAKNLLLRSIRNDSIDQKQQSEARAAYFSMKQSLGIERFHLEKLLCVNEPAS